MKNMTTRQFRRMALGLAKTAESSHMNHSDFRVCNKIFATLGYPDDKRGMVKLTPDQQQAFMQAEPEVLGPCSGAWGRRGATSVRLALAAEDTIRRALTIAWRNTAPKRLHAELERNDGASEPKTTREKASR
jgi:hypothetical protein